MRIDPNDRGDLKQDVARRLVLVRNALKMSQIEFGRTAGLAQNQYNQYETGARLLTLPAALALCDAYLLTLDYIYRGDPSGLPYRLASKLLHNDGN